MSVIDFKTRQIEESSHVSDLELENEYLRSQLRAERLMKINPPRRKHPLHIILALWFAGGFYFLDTVLRLYIAVYGQ